MFSARTALGSSAGGEPRPDKVRAWLPTEGEFRWLILALLCARMYIVCVPYVCKYAQMYVTLIYYLGYLQNSDHSSDFGPLFSRCFVCFFSTLFRVGLSLAPLVDSPVGHKDGPCYADPGGTSVRADTAREGAIRRCGTGNGRVGVGLTGAGSGSRLDWEWEWEWFGLGVELGLTATGTGAGNGTGNGTGTGTRAGTGAGTGTGTTIGAGREQSREWGSRDGYFPVWTSAVLSLSQLPPSPVIFSFLAEFTPSLPPAMASPVLSETRDIGGSVDPDLTISALNSEKPPVHEPAREEQTPDTDEDDKADKDEQDTQQHISFRAVERVDVSVRNLAITVSPRSVGLPWSKKTENAPEIRILDDVSADFPAGELTAIIGGSGSGKVHPPAHQS